MGFLTRLHTVKGEPGEFILTSPLIYELPSGQRISVAESYITDFASTPELLQWLPGMHPNGESCESAVLHDWLYANNGRVLLDSGAVVQFTRAECDGLFYQALREDGVSFLTARAMWAAVRVGGWLHWGNRKNGALITDFDSTEAWADYIERLEQAELPGNYR